MAVLTRDASAPPSWWALMERQQQRQQAYAALQGRRRQIYVKVTDRRWQLVAEQQERRLRGVDTQESDREFEEQVRALNERGAAAFRYLDTLSQELGQWSAANSDPLPKGVTNLLGDDRDLPWQLAIITEPGVARPIWDEISGQYERIAFKPAGLTFDVLILHSQREGEKRTIALDRLRARHLPFPVIAFPVIAQQHDEPKQQGIDTLTHAQHAPPRTSAASITDRLEVAAA